MAKVTSKYQVTVPKRIADEYHIRPGDEIEWSPAGETIRVILPGRKPPSESMEARLHWFDQATERVRKRCSPMEGERPGDRGWTREELYDRGGSR